MIGLCTALATMSLYWPLNQLMILENPTYMAIKSVVIVAKIMLLETIIVKISGTKLYRQINHIIHYQLLIIILIT